MDEELRLLIDLYKGTERQGPGNSETTRRAIEALPFNPDRNLVMADIGCGTGTQTFTLAEWLPGDITAVDFSAEFLEELQARSSERGFAKRIRALEASMDDLPFENQHFDLIWSEGAIYIMGFAQGIQAWRPFLKDEGYLAVSELSWITKERPQELEDYWNTAYPGIDTISNKIKILEDTGYDLLDHFTLPESCWLQNYYEPLESRFEKFLERHNHSVAAQAIVDETKEEHALYTRFSEFYSYEFYIARKS